MNQILVSKHPILVECLEKDIPFIQGLSEEISKIIPYRDEVNNQGNQLISSEGISGYIFFSSGENQKLKENNRYTDYCGGAPHDLWDTKYAPTIGEQLKIAPEGVEFLLIFSTSGENNSAYKGTAQNPQIFIL